MERDLDHGRRVNASAIYQKLGSRTSVDAEYPIIDHGRQCQEVEHVREICPNMGRAIFSHAFRVEPVRLFEHIGVSGAPRVTKGDRTYLGNCP